MPSAAPSLRLWRYFWVCDFMTIDRFRRFSRQIVIFAGFMAVGSASFAYDWTDGFNLEKKEGDRYRLLLSPATYHFHEKPEYTHVWLVGIDRERADSSLAGIAFFRNSFGQSSAYIFPWGKVYRDLLSQRGLYAKVSAGLLYGYRGQYEDRVPFNNNGFSPAIVPSLGWEFSGGYQAQINLLGLNALMFQLSVPLN